MGSGSGVESAVEATGDYGKFQIRDFGTLEIPDTGTHTLELRPVNKEWNPINVRSVTLTLAE
jgi:hypothetical protein